MTNRDVKVAVYDAEYWDVIEAVYVAVDCAVYNTVNGAVDWAVRGAIEYWEAVSQVEGNDTPPHWGNWGEAAGENIPLH